MSATSSCRLKPIEALARERELRGYDVIHELQRILKRASSKPTSCKTPIPGPDTIFVQDSPAALEFLAECGFVKSEEEVVKHNTRSRSNSNAASRSVSPSPQQQSDVRNGTTTINDTANPKAEPSPEPTSPSTSCAPHHPSPVAFIYIPVVPHEHSSSWTEMQAFFNSALELLQWALQCDTGMLTVKIHRLTMFNTPAYTQDIRVQVVIDWKDELGNDRSERHVTPFVGIDVTKPITIPLSGQASSSSKTSSRRGSLSTTDAADGGVGGSHAVPFATLYSGLLATFPTSCDRPCFATIQVSKKRDYLAGEKVKGMGLIGVSNANCVLQDIDLKDPHHDGGLPIGRITVEVDSVRLRCKAVSAANKAASEAAAHRGEEEKKAEEGDTDAKTSPVTDSKVWIEQEKLRELSSKVKAEKTRVYDADDYF